MVESGYLLDATRPNRQLFGRFSRWNRINPNGLRQQSMERLAL
jgi:hypothetical protein